MRLLPRHMALGLLAFAGLAGTARSQPKDDPKVLKAMPTNDGLSLNILWYPAPPKDKTTPDGVIMFPRPGAKIDKSWVALAEAVQAKGFSVLLMDWRGLGMNGPEISAKSKEPPPDPIYLKPQGPKILQTSSAFFSEPVNKSFGRDAVTNAGLNYKTFTERQKEIIFADLTAARFFLDKRNDGEKECNSNRIWLMTEKEGYQVALAHVAYEGYRNAIYKGNVLEVGTSGTRAIKNYAGIVAFSPSTNHGLASLEIDKLLKVSATPGTDQTEAYLHVKSRMAIIAIHGKSEGPAGANRVINRWVTGTEAQLRQSYKYIKEYDNTAVKGTPVGIELVDATTMPDARKDVLEFLDAVVRRAVVFGSEFTEKGVSKIDVPPRHPIMVGR